MPGHTKIDSTKIYAHVVIASRRTAADAIILDMGEDIKE